MYAKVTFTTTNSATRSLRICSLLTTSMLVRDDASLLRKEDLWGEALLMSIAQKSLAADGDALRSEGRHTRSRASPPCPHPPLSGFRLRSETENRGTNYEA
jgi:hypothetical protein